MNRITPRNDYSCVADNPVDQAGGELVCLSEIFLSHNPVKDIPSSRSAGETTFSSRLLTIF